MTSPAPFLSRHFGDYTLVAQLSEDSLGIVYRALYAADERRFVRLRIFHPDALSARAIESAIHEHGAIASPLVHDAIVSRPQLDTVDGVPFMTWDETAGWTLDMMLGRVRALGIRIPAEYALLVGERIAAALEHAFRAAPDGRPTPHGLLWPGFVSISHDAAVRVGGFGVADAVLPSLHTPKLLAEIGPYVAPEVRAVGIAGENSDVYSLGAILLELLTGRRPSLDDPNWELRAGDARSEDLESLLKKCLAPVDARFASAVDAHRALQQLVTANPFSLYTANLSLFLYKLLNPESQVVAQTSDLESTNPVVMPAHAPGSSLTAEPAQPGTPRRRRGDASTDSDVFPEAVTAEEAAAIAASALALESPPAADEADEASRLSEARLHARPPLPALSRAWARPAAALAAAATVAVGAFLVASQIHSIRGAAESRKLADASATGRLAVEAAATTARPPEAAPAMSPAPAAALPAAPGASSAAPAASTAGRPAAVRAARTARKDQRKPAEDLRLRAALARIEADRVNAREAARAVFVEGKTSEEEGERLFRERDYQAAQLAFSRAARLFQRAQELTWEERVRQSDISAGP